MLLKPKYVAQKIQVQKVFAFEYERKTFGKRDCPDTTYEHVTLLVFLPLLIKVI